MAQDNPLAISVIICTHNGARRLQAAVDSLLRQSYDPVKFEVLIVDNDSDDETVEVSRRLIAGNPGRGVRYLFEKERGLSNARNAGVREARGEIVAFMDDDALAETNWLLNIERMFQDAGVQAIGGRVLPVFEVPRPPWLYSGIDSILTILDLGDEVMPFEYPHNSPCGTNMAFRKSVFSSIGYFDPALGRKGRKLMGAEEADLFVRMGLSGMDYVYCPDCVVHHHVPTSRLTKGYVRKRYLYQGYSAAYVSLKYSSLGKVLLRDIRLLFKGGTPSEERHVAEVKGRKGFFFYELKFILYLSYLVSLFICKARAKGRID